ncbi:MAG: DUF2791 family P-loop domain-containing protein [Candidatus Aenigmatarchaeota archaeon]
MEKELIGKKVWFLDDAGIRREGVIIGVKQGGYKVDVKIDEDLTYRRKITEINFLEPEPITKPKKKSRPKKKIDDRRMIESMRLGVVPYERVENFLYGREKEKSIINDWLKSEDAKILLVEGDYGTGKTHLLQYIIYKALCESFATAWVEMDPNETPFHKPKLVYSGLMKRFSFLLDGDFKDFQEFVNFLKRKRLLVDNFYFKHLYRSSDEAYLDWITARENVIRPLENDDGKYVQTFDPDIPPMFDYTNATNIYTYLLSSFGWATLKIGLKGFLLVFDEAETINIAHYYYRYLKGLNFLKALLLVSTNNDKLLNPLSAEKEFRLEFCKKGIAKSVPFLYKIPSGLKIVIALTYIDNNLEDLFSSIPSSYIKHIELKHLEKESLKQVLKKVSELYESAYGLKTDSIDLFDVFKKLYNRGGMHTRLFIKGSIEIFDYVRLYGADKLKSLI